MNRPKCDVCGERHDEPTLHTLMREAHTHSVAIEAVIGAAPGWEQPWSRAVHLAVDQGVTPTTSSASTPTAASSTPETSSSRASQ